MWRNYVSEVERILLWSIVPCSIPEMFFHVFTLFCVFRKIIWSGKIRPYFLIKRLNSFFIPLFTVSNVDEPQPKEIKLTDSNMQQQNKPPVSNIILFFLVS